MVRFAMNREPGVDLAQVAKDVGIHFTTLYDWMKQANIDAWKPPGMTADQAVELAAAKQRIKTLEQEVEVLRCAAAYFSQGHLPGDELPACPTPCR